MRIVGTLLEVIYLKKNGASLVAQMVKNLSAVQETQVWFLYWEDLLEKGMAADSSLLAWRIPLTEELGGLQSMGSQRVRHNWMTNTFNTLMGFWVDSSFSTFFSGHFLLASVVSLKKSIDNTTTIWPSNPTTKHISWGNQNWKRHMKPNVHCSSIYSS